MTRDYCESCGYTDSHDPNCPRPSEKPQSATPRTDAYFRTRLNHWQADADFARQLERELAAMKARLASAIEGQSDAYKRGKIAAAQSATPAIQAAEKVAGIYFEIAEEVVGTDEVRRRFKSKFDAAIASVDRSSK